ncbi:hypothetical protein NDU88_007349 [Pleurodeles waltl]|uniref:Uncharacterized protein n=1 Tax=Pleurodeles waltl TaxID=8319 RepID=A0AAV7VS88_PLEWA|nr:hypothetical protein NDU88_007349 [Pleurodeles waltl]
MTVSAIGDIAGPEDGRTPPTDRCSERGIVEGPGAEKQTATLAVKRRKSDRDLRGSGDRASLIRHWLDGGEHWRQLDPQ